MIVFPIVINIIVILPSPFPSYTADNSNGWLVFFAAYISSIIPFVILFFTLKDNQRENEMNRKLLLRTVEYQVEKEGFIFVKQAIIGYIQSLHIYELGFIPYYPKQSVNDTSLKLKQISESASFSFEQVDFALADYNNEKGIEYRNYLVKFDLEYRALIKDIAWILSFYLPQNSNIDVNDKLKKYKEEEIKASIYFDDKKRVWNFWEDANMDLVNDGGELMNRLLDSFDFKPITQKTKDFIEYEQNRIKKIIVYAEK